MEEPERQEMVNATSLKSVCQSNTGVGLHTMKQGFNKRDINMAASCLLSEDHFLCVICLDVFTDPVSTPCGHNFCQNCITEHWRVNVHHKCPMCKEVFQTRPQLKTNTFISEMVQRFKQEAQQEVNSSRSKQRGPTADVLCDICSETKLKALKSCLECLTSYCQTHLEPHLTFSGLKQHQLINPVEDLEDRMCRTHNKPLELFCQTDRTCICLHCTISEHKNHDVVPLKEEHQGQKAGLRRAEAQIQQMIQDRRLKIQELQHSVDLSVKAADRETAEGVEVFIALMDSVQKSLNQFKDEIREKQRTTETEAQDFIQELELEISELESRSSKVAQLSGSEDHLQFLQRLLSIRTSLSMKTWTEVSVRPPLFEGTVVRAVSQLENKLRQDMRKMFEAELRRVRRFAVDVTLDPDSANRELVVSEDKKQVHHGEGRKKLPDKSQRFSIYCNVFGKQRFSSGRFYFEVQVKAKTKWTVGVARESIDRKGTIPLNPAHGFWTIWLRNGDEYEALDEADVRLRPTCPLQKVGVFVDYDQGVVSFYDADSAGLLYSFIGCHFTDRLRPFFSPCLSDGGKNSAPLVITPVVHIK